MFTMSVHQRMVYFMEKLFECQPRRFFDVLQIELFFRNHELKAKKKAVVHLIVPNHRYSRFGLFVYLLIGNFL